MGRKKKIEKAVESLGKQIERHREKIENYVGKKDYIKEYWGKEIEKMEELRRRKKENLK